jgi:uncharacterized membrane protein (DUF373 family)
MREPMELFKRIIITALMVLMGLTVVLSTFDLAVLIVKDTLKPPFFLLSQSDLLEIFGVFMLILIGLELLETMRAYMTQHEIHAEIVFMVALIAMVRKIIILDVKNFEMPTLLGISALVIALACGFYVFKRSQR